MVDARTTFDEEEQNNYGRNEDNLLDQIPSIYRLLDLVYESGSGGLGSYQIHDLYPSPQYHFAVEKVVVNQQNLGLLLNKLLPGSYQSVSRIDFKALDQVNYGVSCNH
jgi:hypothetical protein